jgi:hypothetical protein
VVKPNGAFIIPTPVTMCMDEYEFQGETVEKVYESMAGDYWVITDDSGAHPFGYACLAGMRQFAEWGTINKNNLRGADVWEVPRENWSFTGPDKIDIQKK